MHHTCAHATRRTSAHTRINPHTVAQVLAGNIYLFMLFACAFVRVFGQYKCVRILKTCSRRHRCRALVKSAPVGRTAPLHYAHHCVVFLLVCVRQRFPSAQKWSTAFSARPHSRAPACVHQYHCRATSALSPRNVFVYIMPGRPCSPVHYIAGAGT